MRYWVAVAALGVALVASPAWGQRRGGGGGFAGHSGFSSQGSMGGFHGSSMGARGGGFGGSPRFGGSWRGEFHGGGRIGPRCFGCFRRGGFYPGYYGGYGYPGWGWYGDLGWYGDDSYAQPYYSYNDDSGGYDPGSAQVEQQQAELDRLHDEVARLRQQRQADAPSSSQVRTRTGEAPTELVFVDKHTEEAKNYAIVGQTLWVFTEQGARKIPLSSVDVPATKKANEDRGLDFELPR